MEFKGRIIRVLPTRGGVSQRGNEWKALPFVFAYYESGEQRFEDKVLLETFDTNLMAQIASYCVIGQDGKVVVENGSVKLKTLDIKCNCGFSHNTKDITTQSGEQRIINEMRCYKLEITPQQAQQPAPQQQQPTFGQQAAAPFPPQVDSQGNPITNQGGNYDDLPF